MLFGQAPAEEDAKKDEEEELDADDVYIFVVLLFGLAPQDPAKAEMELQRALDLCGEDEPAVPSSSKVLWRKVRNH